MNLNQYSRRSLLQSAACGFGYLALAGLTASQSSGAVNPLIARQPVFAPRAKRVIFLFMQGGVSHVDSWDYKKALFDNDKKAMPFVDDRQLANTGKAQASQHVMKPLWDFSRHGQCGHWASTLFPNINSHIDDLCFLHSVHTEGIAHGPATLFLHCGASNMVRPSMGSWVVYGLGSENENLPGFISIAPSAGNGGPRNFGSAFLPAIYQGTAVGHAGGQVSDLAIHDLSNGQMSAEAQRRQFDLIRQINCEQLKRSPGDMELEAVANSYELAGRMENRAPDVLDLAGETKDTLDMYGINTKHTDMFGRQCLMARRLCEAGVRYIQVTYGDGSANPAWDQHSNLPKHAEHARAVDKPVSALLTDLKQRGLLEDTLVWFGSEFGRTPYAQGNGTGRDHNPGGFTVWLAGGGVKPGFAYGATDEFGQRAVENKVHMHDLHATVLALLGLDHEKLTYRYAGRDYRLTDLAGRVVSEIMV
jgi:hypothetical protein